MEVLICTGDRDAFQLVDDDVTVLYPKRGVSEMARMDPAAVEAKYGVPPGALPGPGRAGRRDQRQPARRARASATKTAAKWITQYGGLDGVVAHVDEIKGKAGESLREHLADVLRNYEINRLVDDLELPLRPGRRCCGAAGTARRCTRSSTRWSSGCCATGSTSTSTRSSRRPRPASTWPARCSAPGAVARLAGRARAGRARRSASPSPARSAAAPAR